MVSCGCRRGCWLLWMLLLGMLLCLDVVRSDPLDDTIQPIVNALNIRGAAIAYYDKSHMSAPITRGYGRIASSPNAPNVTPDTTFMLASISKVFTASAVAALLDRGLLASLDDDICNVIPTSWTKKATSCRNPKYPNDKVTWRMMITHRSSLAEDIPTAKNVNGQVVSPSYGPSGGYVYPRAAGNPKCPLTDVQGFYRDILTKVPTTTSIGNMTVYGGTKLNWYRLAQQRMNSGSMWTKYRPGSTSLYSNFAAGYVAALVELLLKNQTFPSFAKQHIFDKLNMTRTAWFHTDLPLGTQQVVPVEYHRSTNGWKDIGEYCYIDYASGQLHTTARDLANFGLAMLQYGVPLLWSSNIGSQVVSCQERNVNGDTVSNCEFGMGWILLDNTWKGEYAWMRPFEQYDWTNGIWHDGGEAGVQTNCIILPKAGVFAFVLTNTDLNSESAAQRLTAEVQKAMS